MSKTSLKKGQIRRTKWQIDKVLVIKKKIESEKEEIIIDELAELFYTFLVNQTPNVSRKLSKQVSYKNKEAA